MDFPTKIFNTDILLDYSIPNLVVLYLHYIIERTFCYSIPVFHSTIPFQSSIPLIPDAPINSLFKGVYIYKVLVYLSSPANQIVQLCVKRKLEILGV